MLFIDKTRLNPINLEIKIHFIVIMIDYFIK